MVFVIVPVAVKGFIFNPTALVIIAELELLLMLTTIPLVVVTVVVAPDAIVKFVDILVSNPVIFCVVVALMVNVLLYTIPWVFIVVLVTSKIGACQNSLIKPLGFE